uniref:Putative secreted protein n=1 Tax=Ixodes ricinus TaxID=34613 RepID=A0A0K8R7I8_IXORI
MADEVNPQSLPPLSDPGPASYRPTKYLPIVVPTTRTDPNLTNDEKLKKRNGPTERTTQRTRRTGGPGRSRTEVNSFGSGRRPGPDRTPR